MSRPRFDPRPPSKPVTRLALALVMACVICFFVLTYPARAHRIESALTTIELNERTGRLEIIHEIYHHDLEHVMSQTQGRSIDFSSDPEALREAVDWLDRDFRLIDGKGRALKLQRVGAEIERGHLLIYYETARPKSLEILKVFNQMLMEPIPQQVNRVNIRIDGPTRTLVFHRGDGWLELPISPSD